MRVKSSQIVPETRVELSGKEAWLDAIYADFALKESPGYKEPISGHLTLNRDQSGAVQIAGRLDFTPTVSCARCDKTIPWPLSVQINTLALPEDTTLPPRDLNLAEDELESYRIVGDELDLEVVVNDAIQTALPSQFVSASADGKSCKICGLDISSAKVFSAGETEQASPFSALRGLKLPE